MQQSEEHTLLRKLQKDVATFMRRLYKRGLTTSFGGNISLKHEGWMLITASQTDKAHLKANEVGILNQHSKLLQPHLKPSMETPMHEAIYAQRADIGAIVHAHPPVATSFTVTYTPINTMLTAEAWVVLGTPVFAGYETSGTEALAHEVAEAVQKSNVVLMKNHGVLAVGTTLTEAFDRIEVLENAAKIHILSQLLGQQHPLSEQALSTITQLIKP